jgi:uncharacterized protein (TIGR00288 family)
MTQDRVMLLIDADNVSLDVIEQAVRLLLNQHGGLHVRRAYCTAESAVKHQGAFKRLGIKPMVNLAAGKNSTDIALAVDAMDLVLSERPEVVVIASSDSDFAPLVHRLREKGCVVRGIGQQGKTGDETQDVYDDYTVLEHHKPAASSRRSDAVDKPARAPRKTTAAKSPAAKRAPAAKKVAATSPAAKAARKTPARKAVAAAAADVVAAPAPVPLVAPVRAPVLPAAATVPANAGRLAARRGGGGGGATVAAVLACLPELQSGHGLALNVAVQRLREAQLLGKNSSSLKLFAQLADHFELTPMSKPTQVRLR